MLQHRHHGAGPVWRLFAAAALLTPFLAASVRAQSPAEFPAQSAPGVFDFNKGRPPYSDLIGLWRFHLGDDPDGAKGWAQPGFDDSAWPLLRDDRGWVAQGFHDTDGMAWYRAKVVIPAGAPPLSLYLWYIRDSSQVFVDGRLIGSFAGMPPHAYADYRQMDRVYPLPQPASAAAHTITIAIRVWRWPRWASYTDGGLSDFLRIGQTDLMQNQTELFEGAAAWDQVSQVLLIVLRLLAALTALSFFSMRRGEREYLWFGISMLCEAARSCLMFYAEFHPLSMMGVDQIKDAFANGDDFATIAFYYTLLRGRRNWLFWLAVGGMVVASLAHVPLALGLGSFPTWNVVFAVTELPMMIWIIALVIQRTRQGLPDARLLFFPALMDSAYMLSEVLLLTAFQLGLTDKFGPDWFSRLSNWPIPFSVGDLDGAVFLLAMMAIFIYRFNRASRQQEQLARELEAARVVQQVLVPEEIPAIAGFEIHSVYKPFGQVGGDFFQILPTPEGGALVVIGDVSGKGMPAAMTVSLLVGTIRTVAGITQEPSEILSAMNQRLIGRTDGGFTTSLVLRADPGGALTIANAGHLPPYVDGLELSVEYGPPLGLDAKATYVEVVHPLRAEAQVTLITDGVVEARGKAGELFGFERAQQISGGSAESIAQAAQRFGQDDDITVLTLTRTRMGATQAAMKGVISLSPA